MELDIATKVIFGAVVQNVAHDRYRRYEGPANPTTSDKMFDDRLAEVSKGKDPASVKRLCWAAYETCTMSVPISKREALLKSIKRLH